MSARDAASAFRAIFEELVEVDDGDTRARLASVVWEQTYQFDFAHMDMDCDDALIELGLARRQGEGDDEEVIYKGGW